MPKLLFVVHAGATLYLMGLIWFVQVVHYPLFGAVGQESFAAYATAHRLRTAWVTAVPMLVELVTAVLLLWRPLPSLPRRALWLGLGLVGVNWLSTVLLQIPQHEALASGYGATAHRLLVVTNWVRTVTWSARGALVLWLVYRAL